MADNDDMAKEDVRDARITVRIPSALKNALEREAERDRRSIADVLIFILEERFAKRTRKGAK